MLSSARKNVIYSVGNTRGRRKQFFNSQAKVEVGLVLVSTEGAHSRCKLLCEILGVYEGPSHTMCALKL